MEYTFKNINNYINEFGQPIGSPIENFIAPARPNFSLLSGNFARIEPTSMTHALSLYEAFSIGVTASNWTYLPYGPFTDLGDFIKWMQANCFGEDPKFYTIFLKDKPAGVAGYLRIEPSVGCIEMGHIHLSPLLQRTREGTEALLLMIEWAFNAGYRRLEWKCDALNAPSCRAAKRLGLSFEGIFRQATIYKSRNRDTAWYAATSQEWPHLRQAYQRWLENENFDANGKEIKKLSDLTRLLQKKLMEVKPAGGMQAILVKTLQTGEGYLVDQSGKKLEGL